MRTNDGINGYIAEIVVGLTRSIGGDELFYPKWPGKFDVINDPRCHCAALEYLSVGTIRAVVSQADFNPDLAHRLHTCPTGRRKFWEKLIDIHRTGA